MMIDLLNPFKCTFWWGHCYTDWYSLPLVHKGVSYTGTESRMCADCMKKQVRRAEEPKQAPVHSLGGSYNVIYYS